MGGVPMLGALLVVGLGAGAITGQLSVDFVAALAVMVGFALVGLADDLKKLGDPKSKGILARYRVAMEIVVGLVFVAVTVRDASPATETLGWVGTSLLPAKVAAALGVATVFGSANATNLTDGLDGLAAGLTAIAGVTLSMMCLALGAPDMAVLAAVIAGGASGFLLLNAKPAKVWMGDVGSLGLGAGMAAVAVVARLEFLFALVAAVFVAEALSVILQVISFQSTGKRIFRMAPLHHHFELCGWSEVRVVRSFWAAGTVSTLIALVVLGSLMSRAGG